jgi:hypothetical protein
MRAMANSTTSDYLAEKDLNLSAQSNMESQQTIAMEGSLISAQITPKMETSPQSVFDSSHEEYPAAFKLAMIVVALDPAMFLVSQNKTLSFIYAD